MRTDHLAGAKVTVHANGSRTPIVEHPVDSNAVNSATSFIEVLGGDEFAVHLTLEPGFPYTKDHLMFAVYLDGQAVKSYVLDMLKIKHHPTTVIRSIDQRDKFGDWTERNFIFGQIETTEGKPAASDKDRLSKVGDIAVNLFRCKQTRVEKARIAATFSGADKIPEKALKGQAISNHAKLGDAKAIKPTNRSIVEYTYGMQPIASYTFKYRSRKDLEIEGILEPAPEPIPLEDRNPDDLTPAEVSELIRLMRARETEAKVKERQATQQLKSEYNAYGKRDRPITLDDDDDDDGEDQDATEPSSLAPKRPKTERLANLDVVDLTEV